MTRRTWMAALAFLVLGSGAVSAQTVIDGVRFDPVLELAGQRLELNGAGVRQRFMIGVYAASLYVPKRSNNPEHLTAQRGPKRVALRFLRDVDSNLFVASLHHGLKANHSEEQLAKWQPQVESLTATIRTIALARRGDSITFDLNPSEGIRVTVNGATRGPVIPGEDFYAAVLRVWIGGKPADESLKKGMVGA
ncbi:MAG: chalcone isomerase family protein [Burkholderiaceae bacterium]